MLIKRFLSLGMWQIIRSDGHPENPPGEDVTGADCGITMPNFQSGQNQCFILGHVEGFSARDFRQDGSEPDQAGRERDAPDRRLSEEARSPRKRLLLRQQGGIQAIH